MSALRLHDIVNSRVLVTRESARLMEPLLHQAIKDGSTEVTLDFEGVDGVTPSFLDEILGIFDKVLTQHGKSDPCIRVIHPPTRLSSKFAAVGRGRGFLIAESVDASWTITPND